MHETNCFITVTYDDDNLPSGGTLIRDDFVKFWKRLRRKFGPIRAYYCGEYGETTHRPHYHACLFGWRPNDLKLLSNNGDYPLYESEQLHERWGMGHTSVGDLTFETAAYTARYVTKKITGAMADDHYSRLDPETGEIHHLTPEFCGMSRRPGIGMPWLKKFGRDTYEKDEVIMRGKPMRPPRAYDNAFEHVDYPRLEEIRLQRVERALCRKKEPERRMYDAIRVHQSKSKLFKRDLS